MKKISLMSLILVMVLMVGCGVKENSADTKTINIAFSKVGFDASPEEVTNTYGNPNKKEMEKGGGVSYTYSSDYLNKDGEITYFFDSTGKMAMVQWNYHFSSIDDGAETLDALRENIRNLHGEEDGKMVDDDSVSLHWNSPSIQIVYLNNASKFISCEYFNPDFDGDPFDL